MNIQSTPLSGAHGRHFGEQNVDRSKLLGMIRNRSSQSDNLEICRECLRQNDNNPQQALDTLKQSFRMAGAGSPSETLRGMLFSEATNQDVKDTGHTSQKEVALPHSAAVDRFMRSTVLSSSPDLVPEDESYQHLSDLREQYRQEHKWQKKSLEDGRKVMILGGLERDVQIFNRLSQESSDSHMSGLNKMHEELLGEVTKELKMLVGNIDLETNQFASEEVALINSLFQILEETQSKLQDLGLGRSKTDMDYARKLLSQLDGLYNDNPNVVRVQFDGSPESLARMKSALLSTNPPLEIFDRETGSVKESITKADFLRTKEFIIKRPPHGTPLLNKFEALFESHPNVRYE